VALETVALEQAYRFAREQLEVIDPDAALDQLSLDADLTTLELDSVSMLSLVAALEDRYGTRIPEAELLRVRTMRGLLELVVEPGATV
jgi:acyl carrier protein